MDIHYFKFVICTAHAFYNTECNIIQDPDVAPAFFAAIEQNRGFVWIFYTSWAQGMLNWKSWMGAATTLRSIGLSTKPFSSELTLAQPYAMRTAAQPPTSTTSIPDSAREDLPNDTHIISFQRKLYGTFTKQSCLGLVWQRLPNVPECSRTAITVEGKASTWSTHIKKVARKKKLLG